jgi:prophage regulatory protein
MRCGKPKSDAGNLNSTTAPAAVRAAGTLPVEEARMRIMRLPEVCRRVGYSPMHIWRRERAGTFPRRVRLGPNSVGWIAEEIDAWIEARIAERDVQHAARSEPSPVGREGQS